MPTYEYRCLKCNNIFEEFHKVNETPLMLKCKNCKQGLNNKEFEKVISKSSFILRFDTNY